MVAETGCDAVMIGRSAPSNPWIFRQIEQYAAGVASAPGPGIGPGRGEGHSEPDRSAGEGAGLRPCRRYEEPTERDRYQMIRTYFEMLIEEEMPGSEGKMKQFASWFTHGVPGGAALRKAIYEAKCATEILARVEEFLASRLPLPGQAECDCWLEREPSV
jgi:tRNA-dihydrouridine synthase B